MLEKQRKITRYTALWFFLFCLLGPITEAKSKAVEKFPAEVIKEGVAFKRLGVGYRRFLFMKAFDAGFYTSGDVNSGEILSDVPKHLEVEYHVGIPAKSLTDYTISHIKLNVNKDQFLRLGDEMELMGQYFVDLKPNDRFSLTYLPGTGTQFAHNGKITGTIAGEEFGRALFSVWIGAKPFDAGLKKRILGLSSQRS